jgi:hypothetical protein
MDLGLRLGDLTDRLALQVVTDLLRLLPVVGRDPVCVLYDLGRDLVSHLPLDLLMLGLSPGFIFDKIEVFGHEMSPLFDKL